jgi:methyl-accepting chemotaxis protein
MSGLPGGKRFFQDVLMLNLWLSLPAVAIVLGCLFTLLPITSEQWLAFLKLTGAYMVIAVPATLHFQRRLMAPVMRWLDDQGDPRTAFTALMILPFHAGILGALSWIVPVMLVSVGMSIWFPSWGLMESMVLAVSGFAAGFLVGSLLGYLIKDRTQAVREALAAAIPEARERASLIRPMTLRSKLLSTISLVALVPVVFAVLLAQTRTDRALEEFVASWQQELLADLPAGPVSEAAAAVERRLAHAPLPVGVRIAELAALEREGALDAGVVAHLREQVRGGIDAGDSSALPSAEVFAWRTRGDEVVVALSPGAELHGDVAQTLLVFGLLLTVSFLLAFAIAYYTAHDISHATRVLRGEAERLSGGDLRRGRIWESEDELGELARSFEAMGEGLRKTVMRVAEAAERVESAAGELSPVSSSVASVTAAQVESMERAASSMEAIDGQVRGIAGSSAGLNESVEEASSSILELGASGEELNETAVRLHESVEGVSSSIEQMIRSVKQVLQNTEALSQAAEETSASMEEMASSLREVDVSAEETSRLSAQVVERAETGQAKVAETIVGMEAIQAATETAEQVIRGLHGRTVEIGAIVDVIDDVADETNLLALNAAIIAAQAGEHGKAFSVVADEIKDLAERVLASTKEIGGLIASVQAEASRATGAIEQGTARVASGVERSAEAGMALEAITKASRESGTRMASIVVAVRAQAQAAGHVVELMEKVRDGVEQIRGASVEQDRGHGVVRQGSVTMREVATQVRGTTEEQARGSSRIRESIEGVREAVEQINSALQEQSQACASALTDLEAVQGRTRTNEEAARAMDAITQALLRHAATLKEQVAGFQV